MSRASFATHGAGACADQSYGEALTHDAPAAIESTIAALARTRNVIDAVFAVRGLHRRHHAALVAHIKSRSAMFAPAVAAAALAYLEAPDEEFLFSRFDGVTDTLRGFDLRVFM
ncbi:MAG: hypothetical protein P4L80_12150 [Xanthobacteraceae bacterium]|nr:hypothetical protein [Xanthobacteraceae bacterium]